jgi:hypothetical protein
MRPEQVLEREYRGALVLAPVPFEKRTCKADADTRTNPRRDGMNGPRPPAETFLLFLPSRASLKAQALLNEGAGSLPDRLESPWT